MKPVAVVALFGGMLLAPVTPPPTDVVRWSPFDGDGHVKPTLSVKELGVGRCTDTYTTAGDIAYRCGRGNGLYFPCWRDGPGRTDAVICTGDPWGSRVERLRSPGLLMYPGVTFRDDAYAPWAVELTDGARCRLFQGAHDAIHRGNRTYVIDYYCDRDDLVLLRNIRRGRVWRIGAARGHKLLGDRTIRRAFFGGLPPPLERQRRLAAQAVATAKRVVHADSPHAQLDLTWVRLTLPDAGWAYVIFSSVDGKGWFAVLRRAQGRWRDASPFRPYCERLPADALRQLFLDRRRWRPPPDWSQGPTGELHC
jgi:hypothetical protein